MAVNPAHSKDLGETWLFTNMAVFSNLNSSTKIYIAQQVELAHRYLEDISQILSVEAIAGGVIIENEKSTLTMGNFVTENGKLATADGEWIEDVKPSFDYCLARM
jgi:hypothetical protein